MSEYPAAPASDAGSLWADLKAAVRGTERDYTTGPVGQAVLLLAVPMVLETVMESIFAVVDVFFVARLGSAAVATVALTESMLTIIETVAFGLAIGVTAVVARRIGEKNRDGAAEAAVQSILLGLSVSVVVACLGLTFAPEMLRLMGASDDVVAVGLPYTRIMLGANATVMLLFLINAAFRGAGDAVIAMRVLWLANAINIFLDPMLILGIGPFPELGIAGAAIATNIGRGTGVLLQLYLLVRGGGRLEVAARHLRVVPAVMANVLRLSGTGMLQVFIGMASWIGLVRILAGFGDEVLAGYAIAVRLIIFALLPSWGMSNAAATMVGQALGARDPDRAQRAVWIAGVYNMVFLGVVGVLFIGFAPQIVGFFDPGAEPLGWGILCLRIVSVGFVFYAWGMVLTQSFNGAGAVWTPTIINLFCFWAFELPFAWLLAYRLELGPNGVFAAITAAFSLSTVVASVIFRRGGWRVQEV